MWRSKRMLDELDADIREHIERETQDNIERGMTPEEARYAAVRKFGNVTRVKEDTRDVWRIAWIEDLWLDIRYGLRMLRNSPGFAAVAVLTLALGIGANTAIFSLINGVMLRSLPVNKPSELVVLRWSARKAPRIFGYMSSGDCPSNLRFGAANPSGCSFSEPIFREIRNSNQFSGVAAFANSGPLALTGNGPASMISGQLVSGDFFHTLGLKAAAGRVLGLSDDSLTAAPVAVLNYGYWQSSFGGARDAVGRTIELNGVAFTIVGVVEQRFTGVTPGSDYDVWLPLAAGSRISNPRMWDNREDKVAYWWLTILGRLKPEMPMLQAQAAISGMFRNEMLHGSIPLFEMGGGMPGPPEPRGGGGPASRQVVVGGPPSAGTRAVPPPGGGAQGTVVVGGPMPAAAGGQGPARMQAVPAPAAQGQARSEAANEPRTLSKPDDEPTVTLVNAQTGLTGSRGRFANPLYVLMFAVGIILLIACSNVAGLMLARAAARQKEIGLRLALGAGRMRIVRQLLTESLLLAATGGILGIVFASWGSHAIVSFVSNNQPRPLTFATGLDLRVLGFTLVISLFTGILFGLAPAFRSVRVDVTPALKEGFSASTKISRGGARRLSIGNALVVTQVALAIVVLVGAGLLVRTLQNLRSIDVGFDSHNLVIFGINPSLAGYKDAQMRSFYQDLQGRLTETPGVRSASYSMVPLLSGSLMATMFHWPGTPQDRPSESDVLEIGPNFFNTMQIPFVAGRNFTASDYEIAANAANPSAPHTVPTPVIVDQAFVAKFFGKENPLGKHYGQSEATQDGPASPGYEIIGVVHDTKYSDLRREISPMMYTPQTMQGASFEVRTAGDPQALVPAIRKVVADISRNLPLRDVTTESQQIDRLLFQERLVARLSGFFGLLALVLACIGLYGLLAYEVTRRTREIGIRSALGAQRGDVLRLVVKQGLLVAVVGAVAGIGVALGVTHYLKSMLYDVSAYDPFTIVVVSALLLLVALAACLIPARRATNVDPMVALRYE
ncbi:MAG TPA: ABC transporter permease [Candidatus Acidoferrum sp.]|nr:ABC transporter permease [Candidatus Acidoferrum sp.]